MEKTWKHKRNTVSKTFQEKYHNSNTSEVRPIVEYSGERQYTWTLRFVSGLPTRRHHFCEVHSLTTDVPFACILSFLDITPDRSTLVLPAWVFPNSIPIFGCFLLIETQFFPPKKLKILKNLELLLHSNISICDNTELQRGTEWACLNFQLLSLGASERVLLANHWGCLLGVCLHFCSTDLLRWIVISLHIKDM